MLQTTFAWTDDVVAEAVEMFNDGRTLKEIAEFFSISRSAVSGFMSRNRDIFPKRVTSTVERPAREPKRSQSPKMTWTDEKVRIAAEMWAGLKSAREIAEALGTTDHAVARYAADHRDIFPKREGRGVAGAKGAAPAPAPVIERPAGASPFDFSGYLLPDVQPVSFLAIGRGECRWPVSDEDARGPEMLCCGAETGGLIYCPAHASLSRGPGTQSERVAHKVLRRAAA